MLLIKDMHGNVWDCSNKPGLEAWLISNYGAKMMEPVGLVPEEAHEWRVENDLPCDCEECVMVEEEASVEPEVDEDDEESE